MEVFFKSIFALSGLQRCITNFRWLWLLERLSRATILERFKSASNLGRYVVVTNEQTLQLGPKFRALYVHNDYFEGIYILVASFTGTNEVMRMLVARDVLQ